MASYWRKISCRGHVGRASLWRTHDDQQSKDNRTDPLVPFKYLNLSIVLFESEGFNPLDNQRRENILDELLRKQARGILYSLKKNGIRDTFRLKKASNLTWWQIILNAFKDQ